MRNPIPNIKLRIYTTTTKKDKGVNTDDSDIATNDDLDNDSQTKDKKERKNYNSEGTNSCESEMYTDMDTYNNGDDASSEESYYEKQ